MERISKKQAGAMIILFEIGSTPLFEMGIKAKQDAWLVVIVGIVSGLLLICLFHAIHRREPEQSLTGMLAGFGFIGKLIAVLYVLYFAYEGMRNIRDIGDLTVQTILFQTPMSLIMLIIVSLSAYAVYKGVEVCFRLAEFFVPVVLLAYIILMVLFFFSDKIHLDRLLPVLGSEQGTFLKEASKSMWFPFGQMVVFLMFWNNINEKKGVFPSAIRSYLISSFVILLMNIVNLTVLGPQIAGIITIPLLQSTQMIEIADVFEHFDVLVFLLYYVGIFFKATLWYLASVIGLGHLFGKDYRIFILPVGAVLYASSFYAPSWQAHLEAAQIVAFTFMVNPIFILFLPVALLAVLLIRGRKKKSSG